VARGTGSRSTEAAARGTENRSEWTAAAVRGKTEVRRGTTEARRGTRIWWKCRCKSLTEAAAVGTTNCTTTSIIRK